MMSKTSLAFFNEPVLRGWCGFWIAPQPHRLGGPQARITRVVSTGDFSWPHAGTFTWPRTASGPVALCIGAWRVWTGTEGAPHRSADGGGEAVVGRALVVFESMFGNTDAVARAVAGGLAEHMPVEVVP